MKFERTCIACRKKGDKSLFIKVVFNKNGNIAVEKDKKLDGRGAYICRNDDCIKKCIKQKSLSRVFKTAISQEFYEELTKEIGNK